MLKYLQQASLSLAHFADGTQRFEEPVSNNTEKACGGVPMVMLP